MMADGKNIRVVCAEDNPLVAEALRIKLSRADGFVWEGWAADADALLVMTRRSCPDLVILDLDMPGRDPFLATEELAERYPDCRVVIFSGHVRRDLIERAVNSGVWGYVSKSDGEDALIEAMKKVDAGEFAFSPEVRATYDR
jgi:DNA-binding NarL/FixJ family response regulator